MVSAMNDQAFAAMLKGDLRRALEVLNKTRRLIKKQSLMGHCVWEVHYTYAELCLRLDLKPPMETIRKISKSHRALPARYLRLKGSQADKGRKRKRALSWWQASIRESRALENRLEEGLTYLEMGKALSEDRCIEQCRDIFSELDARTYLTEAKACATRVDSGQPLSVEHE